jgi:hypothetical protein
VLNTSGAYKEAIVGAVRRIVPRAIIDLVSPDIVYGSVTSSGESIYSKPEDLYDKNTAAADPTYATGEWNRWILNGKQKIYPDTPSDIEGHQGFLGNQLSGTDGSMNAFVQLNVSNLNVLQAASVYFTGRKIDGYAVDFTFTVYSGETVAYSKAVTGNRQKSVSFEGFTVYNPTALRVTVSKWSMPSRYLRLAEILPGIYEQWDGNTVYSLDIMDQADFSCTSLPFATAVLEIYNEDRRFDPRNKSGLFKSIEERQGIPLWMGAEVPAGVEYVPAGVFYQQSGGWSIANNGLTMRWRLVSIVGLLANRKFVPPATLPSTLGGWLAELVSQLGVNFAGRYRIDGDKGSTTLTCEPKDVENVTCGNLLRFVCQASGTYPKADPETGYLWAADLPALTAGRVTLDNLSDFPEFTANNDLSAVIFKIGETQHIVAGTNTASDKTVSINNPFIRTTDQANEAARYILVNYGGNRIVSKGRGDMASEVGDVDIIEADAGTFVSGRRHKQQFRLVNGVMQDVRSEFLQATGEELFINHIVLTKSGTWTAPAGVTTLKIVLIGRGDNGQPGADGTWEKDGAPGAGGLGGKINVQIISINPGQVFTVNIGEETTFGAYTSGDGQRYDGFADIGSNLAFGLPGTVGSGNALPNTGNGGGGGAGGGRGVYGYDSNGNYYVRRYPSPGEDGGAGGSGCVIVYWEEN